MVNHRKKCHLVSVRYLYNLSSNFSFSLKGAVNRHCIMRNLNKCSLFTEKKLKKPVTFYYVTMYNMMEFGSPKLNCNNLVRMESMRLIALLVHIITAQHL